MLHRLRLENIKCGGCANTIVSKLTQLDGVSQVAVDYQQGWVSFDSDQEQLTAIKSLLLALGYPEQGSVVGLSSVGAKAKSFVSCAMGKMSKD